MGDADRIGVMPAAATRINKRRIDGARLWRQFQRTAMIDGTVDQRVIKKAGDVVAERAIPLGAAAGSAARNASSAAISTV